MSANSCVQIKIEEDYDQVLIEDDASDLTGNSSAASSHIQKRQQRDNGKQPSSCPTQTPKRCNPEEQRVNYSFHNTKGQGSVSLACNMGKTTQDSSLSKDSFGTDHLVTLGEILSYCQVMYGAIQKLDEKFEELQAKVTNVHIIQMTPDVFPLQNLASKTPSLSTSKVPSAVSVNTSSVADPVLSMPQLVRVCSPPPPASVEVKRPPALSPVPRFPSPPSLAPQVWLGNRKRNVCISQSALHKANLMSKPGRAVRFLMRCVFSMEEMSCSNTLGDVTRGLKKLDPNKLSAIREWLAKRYPGYDLKEKGKDWRKCMSIMNSTARYLRLMAKRRGLKMQEKSEEMAKPLGLTESHIKPIPEAEADTEPVAEQPMDNYVAEMEDPTELGEPIEEHTAEIDVELSESEEEDDASLSTQTGNEEENSPISCSDIAYEYLGNPERDVKVPQYAMFTALQRTRPELAARVLIKYMFPEEVLVVSNVHGNVESGIRALDYNKISALREHLQERFPWLLLEEDGQDWKVCVGAINSTIRKFRHDLKMGRGRKKGI